jgi:hypothetical protein
MIIDWLKFWFCVPELEGYQRTAAEIIYLMSFDLIYDSSRWGHGVYTDGVNLQIRGPFQKFCTLYFISLKMNLFYKIHLQAFNVISIVLYHSGPTFGQVLCSCQDAFVVDASDYSDHLIRHLLNDSEAFPTEWFLQKKKKVKGWRAHVRTVRRLGKHLPSISFQNLRYCTWGMRPCVNVWSLVTERDLTPGGFFFHSKAPFCRTRTTWTANTFTLFITEVWLTTVAKINDCVILLAAQTQCAELLKWPRYFVLTHHILLWQFFRFYYVTI